MEYRATLVLHEEDMMKRVTHKRTATIGRFQDKVPVHTAPSGTQYVHPIDVFFSEEETRRYVREARAKKREDTVTEAQ